jgi:hypothetical protein
MGYEFINNTLSIPARLLYEDFGVMAYNTYKSKCQRGKLIRTKEGRGEGNEAYISFESLSQKTKEILKKALGDPTKVSNYKFKDFLVSDSAAEKYYRDYELSDGDRLPSEKRREYEVTALILNACHLMKTDINARRKAMGGSRINGLWDKLADVIADLPQHTYPHSLPNNERSLRNKYNKYKKEGYESLIHGNWRNTNSEKLTEESKWWILARWSAQFSKVPNLAMLHEEYNGQAETEGWKLIKEEKTFYNFLYSEEVMPLWYAQRYGELKYKEKYSFQISTKMPSMRDVLWYSDGTKMNYYYQEDGKMKTCQVYEVIDAYSEVLLGYHISGSENYEAQYSAFKMAAQVAGHRPYQIGMDNQGGHNKLEAGNFLSKIARLRISTQPYNGKSKTIENIFKRLQEQHLKKDWFFTGMNIQTKKNESKANMEVILANAQNLPTLDEVKAIYAQRRTEWNNQKHFKTGKPRMEMYVNSSNPETPEINIWDMVDMFWIQRPLPVMLSAYGLTFDDSKVKHTYMKYMENGMPDIEWLEVNIDKKFVIKYDPTDRSTIFIYEATNYGLKFITEMTPKIEVNRGIQEQEDWENSYITKILNKNKAQRVIRRDANEEVQREHGMHLEQHGLNAPTLKGIENRKKKAKKKQPKLEKVLVNDIAGHQKDESNDDAVNYYNEF